MRTNNISEKKEYVVIVNHPVLKKKALELGYHPVRLIRFDVLSDDIIEKLKREYIKRKLQVLMFLYRSDVLGEAGLVDCEKIADNMYFIIIDLNGVEINETERVSSVEDAAKAIPPMNDMESYMIGRGVINTTDYEGRCGNCHEIIRPEDKYCMYCGTERGEGSFLPFNNMICCMYGSPTKKKYRCQKCGYMWITGRFLDNDALFCPQCGEKQITKQKERIYSEFFVFSPIATDKPFDERKRPALFTEENVKELLNQRDHYTELIKSKEEPEAVLKILHSIGFEVPDSIYGDDRKILYPHTEQEDEQLYLGYIILNTTGDLPNVYDGVCCPNCKSHFIAAYEKKDKDKQPDQVNEKRINKNNAKILTYHGYHTTVLPGRKLSHAPFICLCCGTEFGELYLETEEKNE